MEGRGRRHAFRSGAWLLLVLLPLLDGPTPGEPAGDGGGAEAVDRLIAGRACYLRLDTVDRSAALLLRGATLDTYRVLNVETGRPRRFFRGRADPGPWDLRVWTGGRLEPARRPARIEVNAPEEGSEASAPSMLPIPPTAEESIPLPRGFRVRYAGGFTVVVRVAPPTDPAGVDADLPFRNRLVDRTADALEALSGRDTIRLRLTLPAEDAARLYRALPDGVGFLVIGIS